VSCPVSDLKAGETSLTAKEDRLLARINRAYYLPQWCSVNDYIALMKVCVSSPSSVFVLELV
jgi:hypothetical protein